MNASEIIKSIEAEQLKENAPEFSVGDTVKVYVSGVDLVKHKLALSMLKNKI